MTMHESARTASDKRPLLFTPISLRGVTAKNRLVFSPMVQYHAKDGIAGDFYLVHLGRMAQGGFGIVFTEATAVEARGRTGYYDMGLWDDAQIPGVRRIANYVHTEGALLAVQLAHAGRKASATRAIDGGAPLTPADAARGMAPFFVSLAGLVSFVMNPNEPPAPRRRSLPPALFVGRCFGGVLSGRSASPPPRIQRVP